MKKNCGICNADINLFTRTKLADGHYICGSCLQKAIYSINDMNSLTSGDLDTVRHQIKRKEINESRLANFNATKKIGKYLFIDREKEQCLIPTGILGAKINKSWVYSFSDIQEFELLENGNSVSSGGVGRALAGGILFGGVGAVVGGVTGKKKSISTVTSMQIKITTSNIDNPVEYINFITGGASYKTNSLVYRGFAKSAQEILSTLSIIVNGKNENKQPSSNIDSISELREYKKLLDEGIITQEEFNKKKQAILG